MSTLQEINDIRRLAGLPLIEAEQLDEAAPSVKRLLPMFQGIIQLSPDLQPAIVNEINWARDHLLREDRVVWYLRLAQLGLLAKMSQKDAKIGQTLTKKIAQLANKSNVLPRDIENAVQQVTGSRDFKQQADHFLSLPIASIQNFIWDKQLPDEIFDTFKELEEEWREDQDRTVEHDPDAEVVMDFKDGYAWYNLNKAYCSKESKAMGHCGNSPRSHTNDTILSLRRSVQVGDEPVLTPILTFILRDDGMLTEMKGRGNDKPAARYHKYIVPLLRSDIVKGIVGGGYMPENNFSMDDLQDEELRDELMKEKPGLAGPMYQVDRLWNDGDIPGATAALMNVASDLNLDYTGGGIVSPPENMGKGAHAIHIEIGDWSDFESFARDYDDKATLSLLSMLDDIEGLEKQTSSAGIEQLVTSELMRDMFDKLPQEQLNRMAKNSGLEGSKHVALDLAELIEDQGENNPYYDFVKKAVMDSTSDEAVDKKLQELKVLVQERLSEYIDAGFPMKPHSAYVEPEDDENPLGPWHIVMSYQEIHNIVSAGIQGDDDGYGDEGYYEFLQWQEGIERDYDYSSSEWRGEYSDHQNEELSDTDEEDPMAAEWDEDEYEIGQEDLATHASQRLSAMLKTGLTTPTDTSNQMDLPLESYNYDIVEIRRLAGI